MIIIHCNHLLQRMEWLKYWDISFYLNNLSNFHLFVISPVFEVSTTTTDRHGSHCAGSHQSLCLRTTSPPSLMCGPLECWCGKCLVTGKCHIPNSAMMRCWKVSMKLELLSFSPWSDLSLKREKKSFLLIIYVLDGECKYKGDLPPRLCCSSTPLGLQTGKLKLPVPDGCPSKIYKLMVRCWALSLKERPSFTEIVQALGELPSDSKVWDEHAPISEGNID